MSAELLSAAESAVRLGITVATFYDWLGKSRLGELEIRGRRVTISYLQGGARGQGRIRLEPQEVERVRELMRVSTIMPPPRQLPLRRVTYPGINVPLGRPPR